VRNNARNLREFTRLFGVAPGHPPASGPRFSLETDGMKFAIHNFVDRPGQE
jgi:hypothetical protein